MKAAIARSFDPANEEDHALQAAEPLATRCSGCGEVVRPLKNAGAGALIELSCSRCGSSDIYHVNSLRPLSLLIGSGRRN
jgi:predicted RNA-binding Zn-ribbon protein involved in translation (DUF1610 family)